MNEPAPAPAAFRDRSTGLLIFGILTILMGALCALFVPLMLFSQKMAARDPALADMRGILPATAVYAGLALAFIWLGIGSIMARRWARALLVILCWGWLIMGVFSVVAMAVMMPQILANAAATAATAGKASPAMPAIVTIITTAFTAVIFVIIPGIWTAFYSGKNVRATFEHRDPVERWTDRCPLPVLAASLWTALGAPGMLAMPLMGMAVLPFFGNFLTGLPAILLSVFLAIIWGWAAWALYKIDARAWWAVVVTVVLFSVSALLTYSRHDLAELYQLMGYSQAQIAQIQKVAIPQSFLKWSVLAWTLPSLGYLVFIRRYFHKAS